MRAIRAKPLRLRQRGVTLIELLIVVVVVGILVGIAYPSYTGYVQRANRADAQAILMLHAQTHERFFTTNLTYTGSPLVPSVAPAGAAGTNVRYNISYLVAPTASVYTLRAVPANAQVGDACGTMTINQAGAVTPVAGCW